MTQVDIRQPAGRQNGRLQIRIAQVDSARIGTAEVSLGQIGSPQAHHTGISVRPTHQVFRKQAIIDVGTTQVSLAEASTEELGVVQIGPSEIGFAQVSTEQVGLGQVSTSKVGFAQVSTAQVDTL